MYQIPNTPLPSFQKLLGAFLNNSKINHTDLNKYWAGQKDLGLWLSRSSFSMRLLAKLRIQESEKDTINIWFPGYFCNESLEPLKKEKVNIYFYPLLKDGSPDIEACKKLIDSQNTPDLFIAVHFFGREINFSESSEFAKSLNAWFIEDAAHVLKRSENIGKYSHFIFYSPHKILPIADGSILVVNKDNFVEDFNDLSQKLIILHQSLIKEDKKINFHPTIWLIKRILQKIGFKRKVKNQIEIFDHDEINNKPCTWNIEISSLSKRLLMLENNLEDEIDTRKRNYNFWKIFFIDNNFDGEEIFSDNLTICPYLFGITLKDKEQLLMALSLLNLYSIPVSSWPDLPHEVYKEEGLYRHIIHLKKHTIFLPIHSSMNIKRIEDYLS